MIAENKNAKILSVCQVNRYIKAMMNKDELLNNIVVRGEVSNFKKHYATGHLYFTLKDSTSLLKCIMFNDYAKNINFDLNDGSKVIISGNVNVFERDGQYQLYCSYIEPDGVGTLYLEFEKLKKQLQEEGLFDESKKKKIPMFPKRIGVLTSETGAVIRDIINVSTRRFPNVDILLYPVSVQGINSAKEVAHGIELFNRLKNVDVIIIARGGGSLEELWSFNEEETARAIYASEIPVVSAVGHETDFTISDMVADLRAPTPSAAAELVVPALSDLKWTLITDKNKLINSLKNKLSFNKLKLEKLRQALEKYNPTNTIKQYSIIISNNKKHLNNSYQNIIDKNRKRLGEAIVKLNALNPMSILERGYSAVFNVEGKQISTVKDIMPGEAIDIKLRDGVLECEVQKINS